MNYIEEYNNKIQSGEIPASNKLKAVYAHVVDNLHNSSLRYEYDDELAQRAIDFIERFVCVPHSQQEPYILPLWQKALVACIFGFVDKETRHRQYREVFLFVGRRNGKSTLGSAIAIYMLIADGEAAPEIYSAATDRTQAKIVWGYSGEIIDASPLLRKHLKVMSHEIKCPANHGVYIPLSKNSGSLDGRGPSLILLDELHAIKDNNMYNVLVGGTLSRKQPLTLIMSTGGYIVPKSIFETKYEQYTKIIAGYKNGIHKSESILPLFYELDSRAELQDKSCWIKANPNIGISKSIDDLQILVDAADGEQERRDIIVKQFNFRENSKDSFFELEDIVNPATFDIQDLRGSYFVGGIDLSETTDLTCATALIYRAGTYFVLQKYWIPEDTLREHVERDGVPYDKWQDAGLLDTTPGNMIDQSVVTDWYLSLQAQELYPFRIGYDPWRAPALTKELGNNFGQKNIISVPQTLKTLSEPMYKSKALFKARQINYNNNPLFQWNLINVQAKTDVNANIQPSKNRNSNKRIDGYSSFLTALATLEQFRVEYGYVSGG